MLDLLFALICLVVSVATGLGFMVIFGLIGTGLLSPVFVSIGERISLGKCDERERHLT